MKKLFVLTTLFGLLSGIPVLARSADATGAGLRASAKASYDLGDFAAAVAAYTQAIALNADDAEAFSGRGLARRANKDTAGALADCNQALALKPALASAYSHRGRVKSDNKDVKGALADVNKAIELAPDSGPA